MDLKNPVDYDIIVIGGGPAGSTSAYYLAKGGLKVLLLEKSPLPRYKTCGGGVIGKVAESFPFSIQAAVGNFCLEVQINDPPSDVFLRKKREKPIINMVMREDFDNLLLGEAKKAGAEILDGQKVKDIKIFDSHCEVFASEADPFRSKYVIAADGATGITAKKTGFNIKTLSIPALEYEIHADEKTFEKLKSCARFDFIFGGYGWIFPKKDHLSVGIASFKKSQRKRLKQSMEDYLKFVKLDNISKIEKHGYIIPVWKKENRCAKNRVFLTGDAAGLVDPLTGEGIGWAVKSGKLAAESILKAKTGNRKATDIYNREIKKTLLPELRAAKYLAKAFYSSENLKKLIFRTYGNKLCDLMLDVITGERSYHGLLKNPINYLKLLKFNKYKN